MAVSGGGDDLDAVIGEATMVRARFDALPMVVVSYRGPELRLVAANAVTRAFFGTQEALGQPLVELVPGFEGQRLIELMHSVRTAGELAVGREWRVQTGGAETGDLLEYFIDFVVVPFRDADGEIEALGYGIDVTERVLASRAQQSQTAAAEQRYAQARDVITALQRQLLPGGAAGAAGGPAGGELPAGRR